MTNQACDRLGLSVTRPAGSPFDYVHIRADIDLTSVIALGHAARQLVEADARVIYVDLAAVTSLGSSLIGFLQQIGTRPDATRRPVVLCRPTPLAQRAIYSSGLHQLATTRRDLPPSWPADITTEPETTGALDSAS